MVANEISAFEYVSILVSIILGLGITQLLSSLSDLIIQEKGVKFYYPHTVWVIFLLFLHIQDWFITYQLKSLAVWYLPELFFILVYPILLYILSKVIVPAPDSENRKSLADYYFSRYRTIFSLMIAGVVVSVLFNIYLLNIGALAQWPLLVFMVWMAAMIFWNITHKTVHALLATTMLIGVLVILWHEQDNWVIR